MLKNVNRIIFFLIISLFSCEDEQEKLKEQRVKAYEKSVSTVGIDKYNEVYSNANDSLNKWFNDSLEKYSYLQESEWQLDSLICFNKTVNKCLMVILDRDTFWKNSEQDDIHYFYGVKIMNEWYFFNGPTLVLIRKTYQPKSYPALSIEKMKELSVKYIFSRYLLRNGEINDKFFSDFTSGAWGQNVKSQAEWDSIYLSIIRRNHLKKIPKERYIY